ncbi:LysM peptidoglycan-binding domain-containing protein, partial [Streptacidiphilus monticola]
VMGAAAAATAAESGAVAGHSLPVYTVRDTKPAESLWSIAERELGSGTRWREIARLNAGRVMDAEGRVFDADRPIHPGWKLLLPHDAAGAGGAAGGATSGPTTRRPALPRGGKHVTVEPGDTLSAIAERELGAADLWPELYAANEGVPGPHGTRLTDPDVIQPGMVLTIPGTRPKGGSGGHGSGSGHGAHPGQGAGSGSGSAPGPGQGSGAGHGSTGSGAGSGPGAGSGAGSGSSSSGASAPAPTPTPTSTPKSTPTPSTTAGGGSAFGPTGGDSGATPSGSASASDPGTSSGTGTGAPSAAAAVPEAGGRTGFTASSAEQLAGLGSAVLLAVLGGALARRRARRRAAGRPLTRRHALPARPQSDAAAHSGQPPVPSSAPQFVLPEPELQPEQSAENGLDLLDRALRSMARNVIRDGLRLPPLTLARITATGTVELYLATPAPPIPPFRAAHASTVWWCTEEEFGLLGAEAVRGIVAPYPALVSVGTSDDGATVLLDLEAVRLLHVSGPPEDVRAVLRTLALELTLTPLADRVGVHVVGVAEDLAVLAEDRLTVHPDLEHALVALRERDRDVRAELLAVGAATPRDARARGVGGDIWAPDVVLCAEYPSGDLPSALGRLLDARPRGSVAVVTAAPPPGAGPVARWTLPSRGVGALPGLDLTVRLQALDDGGYAAWLDALATEAGTELAQVEHLEPVAPPWPAPAGEPAAPGPWPDVPAPRSSERAGSASGSGASARGPWLVDSGAPGIRAEAG